MLPIHIRSLDDFNRLVSFGSTPESVGLEFKAIYDKTSLAEIRKDVLAMANTWGGTILVGVSEASNAQGEKVALGLVPQQSTEELKKRINDALASKVFPNVRVETYSINVPTNDSTGPTTIVSVCVFPLGEALAAFEGEGDGEIKFPYRDNIGVKYFKPAEVTKRMDSKARRIMVRSRELGLKDGATVQVASPVLLQRFETEAERLARVQSEMLRSPRLSANQQRQVLRDYRSNPRGLVHSPTDDQFSLSIDTYVVDVPFGAVRELWSMGSTLGIALECEIHIIVDPQPAAFLQFSSR